MQTINLRRAPSGPPVVVEIPTDTNDLENVSLVPGATLTDALNSLAGGGGGAVSSVFGRTGDVLAEAGDYDASEIGNDSDVPGATVADALNALGAAQLDQGNLGATPAVDFTVARFQSGTLDANATFTITLPPKGTLCGLRLTEDGTGGRTVAWPGSVAGNPSVTAAAAAVTVLLFYSDGAKLYLMGGTEHAWKADGNSGAAKTIDFSVQPKHSVTVSQATTLTIVPPAAGKTARLNVTNGSAFVTTWAAPAGFTLQWAGGAAPVLSAAGKDMLAFELDGTIIMGALAMPGLA